MTSYLIDINVWLALSWHGHAHNDVCHEWLSGKKPADSQLLFCRTTQLGFLRLITNTSVVGAHAMTLVEAFSAFDTWVDDPRCGFAMEPPGLERLLRDVATAHRKKGATKTVMDSYLVAFCIATDATLVTLDSALAQTARQHKAKVVELQPR